MFTCRSLLLAEPLWPEYFEGPYRAKRTPEKKFSALSSRTKNNDFTGHVRGAVARARVGIPVVLMRSFESRSLWGAGTQGEPYI